MTTFIVDWPAVAAVMNDAGDKLRHETAESTADLARLLAPAHTGRLRASIGWRPGRDADAVEATAPYALFVHVGAHPHQPMRAHPFLRAALLGTHPYRGRG